MSIVAAHKTNVKNTTTVHDLDVAKIGLVDHAPVVDRLRAVFRDPRYRPPLPPSVAMEVMALSKKPSADAAHIAALFEKDPLLAARVLQLARAPMYGAAAIHTMKDAVVRLGGRVLYDLVLEAALTAQVFKSPRFSGWMERIRRHSVAVAHGARAVARSTAVDAEHAFLAGLVHDVGAAAVLIVAEGLPDVTPQALAMAMKELHLEAGALVSLAWQMPEAVQYVVSHHHSVVCQGYAHPVVAAVTVAEHYAVAAGFDGGIAEDDPGEHKAAVAALELSGARKDDLEKRLANVWREVA